MDKKLLNGNLWDTDPELFDIIVKEKKRQEAGLEMIASENFTSVPVLQCLSSCLHNKYSEGMPHQRYLISIYYFWQILRSNWYLYCFYYISITFYQLDHMHFCSKFGPMGLSK